MMSAKESMLLLLSTTFALVGVIVADQWREYRYYGWSFAAIVSMAALYFQLKQPNNYRALVISGNGLYYDGIAGKHNINWQNIENIEFVREPNFFLDPDGRHLDKTWVIKTNQGKNIFIPDEWPHRKNLLHAFATHVQGFNIKVATYAMHQKSEGKWQCK